MAQPAPDQPVRDLSDILPSEVLSGGILGALIGSTAAILGALDIGAVRLAIAGAGVFGALGLAFWISRVAAASSVGSWDSPTEERTQGSPRSEQASRPAPPETAPR